MKRALQVCAKAYITSSSLYITDRTYIYSLLRRKKICGGFQVCGAGFKEGPFLPGRTCISVRATTGRLVILRSPAPFCAPSGSLSSACRVRRDWVQEHGGAFTSGSPGYHVGFEPEVPILNSDGGRLLLCTDDESWARGARSGVRLILVRGHFSSCHSRALFVRKVPDRSGEGSTSQKRQGRLEEGAGGGR